MDAWVTSPHPGPALIQRLSYQRNPTLMSCGAPDCLRDVSALLHSMASSFLKDHSMTHKTLAVCQSELPVSEDIPDTQAHEAEPVLM